MKQQSLNNVGLIRKLLLLFVLSLGSMSNLLAADYYWVGRANNNNWTEINNWASVSGGTGGRMVPPTSTDDVIFDKNSFTPTKKTVTINSQEAKCNNITFQNDIPPNSLPALTFSSTTNKLTVSGSVTLVEGMTMSSVGIIELDSDNSAGETLTTRGITLYPNITISGDADWETDGDLLLRTSAAGTLAHSPGIGTLTVNGNLTAYSCNFAAGNLIVNNGNVTTGNAFSFNGIGI